MLKKYFDLFSAYFKENGTMRESCHPGEFVLGLLPLLQQAENEFMPYNVYKELYDAFKSQSFGRVGRFESFSVFEIYGFER